MLFMFFQEAIAMILIGSKSYVGFDILELKYKR